MEKTKVAKMPFALSKDEGKAIWFVDGLITVRASGEATDNRWTVLEYLLPPGQLTPAPVHHAEDEAWYILEGAVHFRCGDPGLQGRCRVVRLCAKGCCPRL